MWDYPRPPALDPSERLVVVSLGDVVVAESTAAIRVLETSHPPAWYVPPGDVDVSLLSREPGSSYCEWKGAAEYWTVTADGRVAERAAWCYPRPTAGFEVLAGYFSFYPSLLDCRVDGMAVEPQPGGFYGGWITPDVVGPFKGSPGTMGW